MFWHVICAKLLLSSVLDVQHATVTGNPMGEAKKDDLRVSFDNRVRVKFVGSKVTTDAGLLVYRELDEVLSLTKMGAEVLTDSRLGQNKQHGLVPMLR